MVSPLKSNEPVHVPVRAPVRSPVGSPAAEAAGVVAEVGAGGAAGVPVAGLAGVWAGAAAAIKNKIPAIAYGFFMWSSPRACSLPGIWPVRPPRIEKSLQNERGGHLIDHPPVFLADMAGFVEDLVSFVGCQALVAKVDGQAGECA